MADVLPSSEGENALSSSTSSTIRSRDEVFWTELEIRRLGNLVAECIHARRYVGETSNAIEERALMQSYIEAMKRKAMRVLHRAELYAKTGYAAWPGIDGTISDPVSLAEEYVRVVENYEGVLREEEARVRREREERSVHEDGLKVEGMEVDGRVVEEWEKADDVAYKEALKREVEMTRSVEDNRNELLGAEGVRRRKAKAEGGDSAGGRYSKEDEELMARHQPIQDELTSNLVDLVGQLKDSITENKEKIEKDRGIVDQTEDAVDKNLDKVKKQRGALAKYAKATSVSWWVILIAAIVIVLVFIIAFVLLKIPL
eukprot:GFKZ01001006.1.p1 GENE.GFKZ01001006.1~~GFKZ01001006.1.p1  ORF type:complete len:357 (+),score=81.80 GFKZ01001006.1:127-1071(+)